MKKNKKYNVHHLVQKVDGGSNHPINLVKMDRYEHTALHILFGENCTLPIDKIQMILDLHKPVLCIQFVNQIQEILDFRKKQGKDAYNRDAYTRKAKFKTNK